MTASGSTKDYDFEAKNVWRAWLWTAIRSSLRRNKVKPRNAVVLGLFGVGGLDLQEATRFGIRTENVFSVEKDSKAARMARSTGMNVIHGKLSDVLWAWDEPRVDALVLDFCGSYGEQLESCVSAISERPSNLANIVAVNLLRGRDPGWIKELEAFKEVVLTCNGITGCARDALIERHRAGLFFAMVLTRLTERFRMRKYALRDMGLLRVRDRINNERLKTISSASFHSYNSGKLVFNSGVLNLASFYKAAGRMGVLPHICCGEDLRELYGRRSAIARAGRCVSAAKAIRTMRSTS